MVYNIIMDRVTTFAKRIKEYREAHDLTLADMEKITGVPAQTINRYELNQRTPKIDVAINIANKLQINPMWLQGYSSLETASPFNADLTQDEFRLLLAYRSADNITRQAVCRVLKIE